MCRHFKCFPFSKPIYSRHVDSAFPLLVGSGCLHLIYTCTIWTLSYVSLLTLQEICIFPSPYVDITNQGQRLTLVVNQMTPFWLHHIHNLHVYHVMTMQQISANFHLPGDIHWHHIIYRMFLTTFLMAGLSQVLTYLNSEIFSFECMLSAKETTCATFFRQWQIALEV